MKLGIIIPYTGSELLTQMTETMVADLFLSINCAAAMFEEDGDKLDASIVLVNNGADRSVKMSLPFRQVHLAKNEGCAAGYNKGWTHLLYGWKPDYVLTLNNDLRMPQVEWLYELLKRANPDFVCVPGTNRTASTEAIAKGPQDRKSTPLYSVSAYAWLIPSEWIEANEKEEGWPIFDPDFFAYGEDNWTALLWQNRYGPEPFRIVHASWIDHLKAQSAAEVTSHADRLESSRTLRSKVAGLLTNNALRDDVAARCRWYLKVLQK